MGVPIALIVFRRAPGLAQSGLDSIGFAALGTRMDLKWLLVMLLCNGCYGARVLVLTVLGSKSHKIGLTPIMEELVQRGHTVTIVTPYQSKELTPGITEIVLKTSFGSDSSWFKLEEFNQFTMPFYIYKSYAEFFKYFYGKLMADDQFKAIIDQKLVDVVIVDDSFNEYCLPVIESLSVPFIFYSASTGYPSTWASMGASQELATVPNRFSGFDNQMDFWERLTNTATVTLIQLVRNWYTIPAIDRHVRKDLPNSRSILDIEKDASLFFISSKSATSWTRPLPPKVVPLGPLHVRPALPLPSDLLEFVEGSGEDGFVLFTLGSMKSSGHMPQKYLNALINAFGRLPQRVVWKWDSDTQPENLPANILMATWLPQQDLLGHGQARLFITHGGLLGMQEATYHGVPLLALPFATDQNMNAAKANKEGNGLKLQWKLLDEHTLYDAITTIIDQPSFKANAMRLSSLMRDELVSAKETAAYWIEYVVRHNGTKHFNLSSEKMPLYQYYLLDVAVCLGVAGVVALFAAAYLLVLILRVLRWLVCGPNEEPVHLKSQ